MSQNNEVQNTHPYVYVLVRTDISVEQQIVQSNHASLEVGFKFGQPDTNEICSMVVLSVPDKAALLEANARLNSKGIQTVLFDEPSWDMGFSALATQPLFASRQRKALSKYKLWRLPSAEDQAA